MGATDYMACSLSSLYDFLVPISPNSVILPTGVTPPISYVGTVHLSPNISLMKYVLISDFFHNLLSVSKLIFSHDHNMIFSSTHYIFQDSHMRITIGMGKSICGAVRLEQESNSPTFHSTQSQRYVRRSSIIHSPGYCLLC